MDDRIKKTLKHHCLTWYWTKAHTESCKPFLDRMSFCIHLADVKASTISRKLRTSKYQSFKTFKIWSDSATNRARGEIDLGQKNNDAEKIIDELINATDLASFYDKYKQDFITRSEDKARCPFASLHTHNELTALWFNFLFNNSDYFEIPEIISDIKDLRKTVHRVAGKRITLVRIRLATPGKLSRLRDVKLIKDIPDELKDICNGLKGEIIYELPEEILLVTKPEDADDVKSRIEKTLNGKTNYYCETSAVGTVMQNKSFLHNYEKIFGTYKSNYYPFLLTEIAPAGDNEASHRAIICDMCQMAPAQTVYPREAHQYSMMIEPVEEYLCDGCLRVRTEAD
ncbi:hypothetical protein COZ60_03090, partial [Candidatus Bathyarchaeota archaeon CG_4_8_14_3_um_filter_42_8]